MDLNIEKDQNLYEEHSQQQCFGCLVTAVHLVAGTTLTIQGQGLSKTFEPFKPTTRESMESSLSCAENAARPSLLEAIGEPTRRIVASFGIALVGLISNTKGLSKIISRPSDMVMLLVGLTLLKTMNPPPIMNPLMT
ncbi:hypothetical protein Ddye_022998 [Dipteronia dyeriana]|uniref:Uncharacterized protein n=1 Tax=Dipteronia dyeriana TaxID=168575 RepID=A0AAD9WSZ3_9ROSI|nr:hypothetical protein Ddye_022998 [Dipteronia dyeriana]